MTQLVRSMTPPNTVHDPLCKVKGNRCEPWLYATMRSLDEIRAETRHQSWLHLCKRCVGGCGCSRCNPAGFNLAANAARPILAVDVDGVLNALSFRSPPPGWEDCKVRGYRIRFNPSHGKQLLAVAEQHGAELTWCTTWEELAPEHIAPLVGLPDMPWVPMEPGKEGQPFRASVGMTKAAAMRIYAGERPFCWLDDEPDAAAELASHPVPHKVIEVEPCAGLQDHHLREASDWLSRIVAGATP